VLRSDLGKSAERVEVFRNTCRTGGVQAYWKKRLDYLKERAKRERVSPLAFASSYARAGREGTCAGVAGKGLSTAHAHASLAQGGANVGPLRSDPRFQDLQRRMNFPP
jgi:hypothetical protein